jgi:hypothetical protein
MEIKMSLILRNAGPAVALMLAALSPGLAEALAPLAPQPIDERRRQKPMPIAPDALWTTLRTTRISGDLKGGVYRAEPPPAVQALAGRDITITGFMLPLDPSKHFNHFILTRNTPVCPFCMPGEPNEVVEVYTTGFVTYSEDLVAVTGHFALEDSGQTGLFFKLDQAKMQ